MGEKQAFVTVIQNRDNVGMKWTNTPTYFDYQGDSIGYNFVEARNRVKNTSTESTTLDPVLPINIVLA